MVCRLLLFSHPVAQHSHDALVNLTHEILKIQDGIERLSLQKMLAIHLLQMNNSKQSMTKKSQRHDLCIREQPRVD